MANVLGARRLVGHFLGRLPKRHPARQPSWASLQTTSPTTITQQRQFSVGGHVTTWGQFLEGGSKGISGAVVHEGGLKVQISWLDGHESVFSLKNLRDNSTEAINPQYQQREIDTSAIPNDKRVEQVLLETVSPTPSNDTTLGDSTKTEPHQIIRLRWDGEGNDLDVGECTVPIEWLRQHCNSPMARDLRKRFGTSREVAKHIRSPVLWGADVFDNENGDNPLVIDFKSIMEESPSSSGPSQLENLRNAMKSHGVALVRGVPSDEAGTLDVSLKLGGHVRSTFYGAGMWTIVAEEKSGDRVFHDKGYTTDGNLLHTDCTYFVDPPGYQLLTCDVKAPEGGVSTFVDGFAVAERLRVEHPEAYEFFTTTSLRYKHIDDECHYVNEGPIFRLDEHGQVDQVRHNDYDRTPLDYLSSDDVDRFYEHHKTLIAIMRDPTMLARHLLEPGDSLILNNQRGIHGRESFKGWRRMVGYFIGMDEVDSMARMHNV